MNGDEAPRASAAFMDAIGKAPSGSYQGRSPIDGVQRVVHYYKLENYPLYVQFGLGMESVLAAWRRQSVMYGLFAMAAMLGLGSMRCILLWSARVALKQQLSSERRDRASKADRGQAYHGTADGSAGPTDLRHRARLQQFADVVMGSRSFVVCSRLKSADPV